MHAAVAAYLRQALRSPVFWTTFPAGGGGKLRGQMLRGAGLKAGVPDILVFAPTPAGNTHVIGIELKTSKGRVSQAQVETHAEMVLANVTVRIARSIEDVQRILELEGVRLFAWTFGPGIRRAA